MLPFYASKFNSVEINSTFYHMPRSATVGNWLECSPDDFVFCLKAPKTITHIKRLSDVEELVNRFYEAAGVLAHKLGVVLYQLPPSLKKDLTLLEGFLKLLDRNLERKQWNCAMSAGLVMMCLNFLSNITWLLSLATEIIILL